MADHEDRSFQPSTVSSNRSQMQGLGAGQEEIDKQRQPNRGEHATSPQRTEPFDQSLDPTTNSDRPSEADFSGQEPGDTPRGEREGDDNAGERRDYMGLDPDLGRDEAGVQAVGDLGAGTPPGVDIHDLGQKDKPEQEWGEPAEGAMFSSTNTRRGIRTEAERGQGAKTRQHNKDIFSRRV